VNERFKKGAPGATIVPDAPLTPEVYGLRGLDERWIDVPPRADVNAGFVPEAPRDGGTYGRNGRDGRWQPVEGGAVWIGPAPPAAPVQGTLWWCDDPDGSLFIFFDGQWVPASPSGGGGAPGIGDAPADGRTYVRRDQAWVHTPGDYFTFAEQITLLGNEVSNTAAPAYMITVPPANLPLVPMSWTTSGGIGNFFVSNFGLGARPIPGNINWAAFIEDGWMSNNWAFTSSITMSTLNVAPDTLTSAGSSNRIFTYDPGTDGGIRIGWGMIGGTNGGGWGPIAVWLGLSGQILNALG
jgi:hypothetical protein